MHAAAECNTGRWLGFVRVSFGVWLYLFISYMFIPTTNKASDLLTVCMSQQLTVKHQVKSQDPHDGTVKATKITAVVGELVPLTPACTTCMYTSMHNKWLLAYVPEYRTKQLLLIDHHV